LRPQFTTNYEANISVDERPILAVGVNDTKDIFTNVIYQSDTSQSQAYRTYDNLGKNKEWYFRALGALPPAELISLYSVRNTIITFTRACTKTNLYPLKKEPGPYLLIIN
jgi:hypothetical protein